MIPVAQGELSLTNCGPVDRVLARIGLKSSEPPRLLVRAIAPALAIWLPLCVTALFTTRPGGAVAISFFEDLTTHVRFLVVVPALILAEAIIGRRTKFVAAQFVAAELVAAGDRQAYRGLLRAAERALESRLAEFVVVVLAAAFVLSAIRGFESDGIVSWFETLAADGSQRLAPAGWWYVFGSWLPPFLFLRWTWRFGVWCWFLQRASRFDLQLVATHPDRTAGLAFVGFGQAAFAQLAFAAGCLVAGAVGHRILHEGGTLLAFKAPLAAIVGIAVVIGVVPLVVFRRPLLMAKERGLADYGSFCSRYVRDFQRRWIDADAGANPLDAQDDIGPLADIGASFERVGSMRTVPVTLKHAITFAAAAAVPMLPLLLTVMSLKDLLKLLAQAMI